MDLGCLGGAVSAELPGASGLSTERNAVIVRSPATQDQAWFTKERWHGTIWEVEGAFPRSLWSAFSLLSDCVTPIDLGPRTLSVFMNEVRIHEFLSVPQFHGSLKLFLKLRKKNQATTENRFQSLLGCKMGTETEPGIEKEFKETFEKRHLWYWVDKGSVAIQVNAELEFPKNKKRIAGEIWGRREKCSSEASGHLRKGTKGLP